MWHGMHGGSTRAGADVGAHACSHLLEGETLWQLAVVSSGGRPPADDASTGAEATRQRDAAAAAAGAVLLRAVSHPRYGLWEPLGRHSRSSTLKVAPVRAACVSPHRTSQQPCELAAGAHRLHRPPSSVAVVENSHSCVAAHVLPNTAIREVLRGGMLQMVALHSSLV